MGCLGAHVATPRVGPIIGAISEALTEAQLSAIWRSTPHDHSPMFRYRHDDAGEISLIHAGRVCASKPSADSAGCSCRMEDIWGG